MAGIIQSGWRPPTTPTKPDPKNMDTYPASILQAGQDYDALMARYKDILDKGPGSEYGALTSMYKNNMTGQAPYQRSPDMAAAGANLNELSQTGGYTPQGISDLRSRGISPIRSVYANAMQNVNRQKSLQGGYAPNAIASLAHLTRGLSNDVSQGTQNVNANIAQNVAGNRMGIAGTYGNFASGETGMMNEAARFNAGSANNNLGALVSLYGMQQNKEAGALEGMRSLYGTTPANPALYGQQALNTAQLEEQQRARKQQGSGALINSYMQGARF